MAKAELRPDRLLAMSAEGHIDDLPGIDTTEPAFGISARWIRRSDRARAELGGYKVIEPVAVLATHLTETIRMNASDILGRQEVQRLIDTLKEAEPVVVAELLPDLLSVGQVQKVLQNLLRERIPIRHLGTIFEALADRAAQTKDVTVLTEVARASLKRVITGLYTDSSGCLQVMTLEPKLEETLENAVQRSDRGSHLAIDASSAARILRGVADAYQEAAKVSAQPALLTTPALRPHLRTLIEHSLARLPVLSYNELAPDVDVKSVAFVRMAQKATVEDQQG
jgi:flagellar biosynthesis protein FlhA